MRARQSLQVSAWIIGEHRHSNKKNQADNFWELINEENNCID